METARNPFKLRQFRTRNLGFLYNLNQKQERVKKKGGLQIESESGIIATIFIRPLDFALILSLPG